MQRALSLITSYVHMYCLCVCVSCVCAAWYVLCEYMYLHAGLVGGQVSLD